MEKSKKTYFKSLFESTDVFLAILVGLICAAGFYYIDAHNLLSNLSNSVAKYIVPVLKSGLVIVFACLLAIIVPSLKESKVNKLDGILIAVLSCSIGALISFAVNNAQKFFIVLWAIILAISAIFLIIRVISVSLLSDDSDTFVNGKRYFSILARKYNLAVVYLVCAIVGLLVLANFSKLVSILNTNIILYSIGGVAAAAGMVIVYSVIMGKKTKINIVDVVLASLMVLLFLVAGRLFLYRKVRNDVLWLIVAGAVSLTLLIRYLTVSVNIDCVLEKKGPRNYYGAFLDKHAVSLPIVLGGFAGLSVILIGYKANFRDAFKDSFTGFLAILFIAITVFMAVLLVIGLAKKGLTSKKINLIDFPLFVALFACLVASPLLIIKFSIFRLCLVLVPFVIAASLSIVRIVKVELINPEVIKDDVVVVKLRIVNEDDGIHAYCNDKEIAVIDNRTNKEVAEDNQVQQKEVVEEKVEQHEEVVEETNDNIVLENENPVEEEIHEEVESNVENLEETNTDEQIEPKLVIAKRSFENKIKFTSSKTKNYYSIIKNELLAYRAKSKVSKKSENFRKKGLIAKISVSGKSLRVHLALDPKAFDVNKYHQIDLGEKKAYKDVPFTMKVRSDLACRRVCELIALIAQERSIRRNSKYEVVDFVPSLDIDGAAILEKVGQLSLLSSSVSKQQAEALTDDVLKFIPTIKMSKALNEEIVNVYVDTALKYVKDEISVETLRKVQQIPATIERINVKSRTGLDSKITVIADEIDDVTAKAIILTGGKVFKIVR